MRRWGRQPKQSLAAAAELFNAGDAATQRGALQSALTLLADARRMYLALTPEYEAEKGLARTLWRLSTIKSTVVTVADAASDAAEAAQRWETLLAGPGADDLTLVRELTRCYTDLCILTLHTGDEQRAVSHGRRAVQLAERLVREGHRDGRTELGTARHNLAVALGGSGDLAGAATEAAAAVVLRGELADDSAHPSLADWEHANSLLLSGRIYRARGRARFAETAFNRALELASTLGDAGATMTIQIMRELAALAAEDRAASAADPDKAP